MDFEKSVHGLATTPNSDSFKLSEKLNTYVQLSFATKHLRAICESKSVASRHLDGDASRNLRARLADLRAAENVTELCLGNPREMPKMPNTWMINISDSKIFAFEPGQQEVPKLKSGLTDWSKVTRIKVIHIGALTDA